MRSEHPGATLSTLTAQRHGAFAVLEPHLRSRGVLLLLSALTLIGLLVADEPLSQYAETVRSPSMLRELYDVSQAIGNSIGILALGWIIVEFDESGEAMARVLFLGFGAGLLAIGIARSINLLSPGHQPDATPFAPAAQLASAMAVAIALTSMYPRAWRLMATMMSLLALARLAGAAHMSDVFGGALVGWFFAILWLRAPGLRLLLARVEGGGDWLLLKSGWLR